MATKIEAATRISRSVHSPVMASALALEGRRGGQVVDQAIFVSCDLAVLRGPPAIFRGGVVDKLRERIKDRLPGFDIPLVHKVQTIQLPMRKVTAEESAHAEVEAAKLAKQPLLRLKMQWYQRVVDRYQEQSVPPCHRSLLAEPANQGLRDPSSKEPAKGSNRSFEYDTLSDQYASDVRRPTAWLGSVQAGEWGRVFHGPAEPTVHRPLAGETRGIIRCTVVI